MTDDAGKNVEVAVGPKFSGFGIQEVQDNFDVVWILPPTVVCCGRSAKHGIWLTGFIPGNIKTPVG